MIVAGCKKLVEVNPPVTSVTGASVYSSDATAIAAVTGIYTQISGAIYSSGGFPSLSLLGGLSADELSLYSGVTNARQIAYYTNSLSAIAGTGSEFWFYSYIFTCNSAIDGLTHTNVLTPAINQQLLGEAKFMRALVYFYLVNLYGDVPMPLTTDYKANSSLPRTLKAQVYQQVIADLKDAQNLLSTNYLDGTLLNVTTERVRPTKWAATALLGRVYLYSGDWPDAEAQATALINNSSVYGLNSLNNVFLKNSTEAIWQLQPVTSGNVTNTQDAKVFILPSTGPNGTNGGNPVYLSDTLLNSFEPGDQRRANWVGSVKVSGTTYYFPYKYKVNTVNAPVTEYLAVLRLGEQYLIRAEARAQQGNGAGALQDLDTIRHRASLPDYAGATDQASLLTAILHERQVELFTEWGHRWLDLKRTGTIDALMTAVCLRKGTGVVWQSYKQLFPLPLGDLQADANLSQNPGY